MSNPSLNDEGTREAFLQNVRDGMRRGSAGEALDLTRTHVFGYIASQPMFEMRVIDAEGEATEHIEEALWQAGASGNVTAARIWLEREERRKKDAGRSSAQTPLAEAIGHEESDSSDAEDKVDPHDTESVEDFLRGLGD